MDAQAFNITIVFIGGISLLAATAAVVLGIRHLRRDLRDRQRRRPKRTPLAFEPAPPPPSPPPVPEMTLTPAAPDPVAETAPHEPEALFVEPPEPIGDHQ